MQRKFVFSFGENYHIYNRGVEKRDIFLDHADYERFIFLLRLANDDNPVDVRESKKLLELGVPIKEKRELITSIGAWCLMPNHFHLLLNEKVEGGISKFMSKLLTGYTMYFNRKYKRKGRLFENTFQARHADTDNHLKYLLAYIHLNPVKLIQSDWKEVGIVDLSKANNYLDKYEYSSYVDYANPLNLGREERKILNRDDFPKYFETELDFKNDLLEWLKLKEEEVFTKGSPSG